MTKAMAILAVEDQLGETVSRRILDVCGIEVSQVLGLRGKGPYRRHLEIHIARLGFSYPTTE